MVTAAAMAVGPLVVELVSFEAGMGGKVGEADVLEGSLPAASLSSRCRRLVRDPEFWEMFPELSTR